MNCLYCGINNKKHSQFCVKCGAPFPIIRDKQKRPQPNVTPKVYEKIPISTEIKSCFSTCLGIGLLFLPGIILVWYRTGSILKGIGTAGAILGILVIVFVFLGTIAKLFDV